MKALVKVGYLCNNRCVFCHVAGSSPARAAADTVAAKIDLARDLGCDMVVLSGGEPTVRRELLSWARRARANGLALGLVTNGRMLAYGELCQRLVDSGLAYVHLGLHGGSAEVHDRMVQASAFAEEQAALGHLAGRGLDVVVNTVVTRLNGAWLREVVDLVSRFEGVGLKLAAVEPKGAARERFAEVVPPVSEAAAWVRDAVAHARRRGAPTRLEHEGLPLCLLGDVEATLGDLPAHGFAWMSEAGETGFFPVDDANRVQPEPCRGCRLSPRCPGLYREYLRRCGHGELRPVHD